MNQSEKQYLRYKKQIERSNKKSEKKLRSWQHSLDDLQSELALYESPPTLVGTGFMAKGENLFGVYSAGLVEERPGESRYVGGHSGISIPIGSIGGRSIRYSSGSSRGHIERSAPVEKVIDSGEIHISEKRVTFIGSKQTRDCNFEKILDISYPYSNRIVISLSGRQKPVILEIDRFQMNDIRRRIQLAVSLSNGTHEQLIDSVKSEIITMQSEKPTFQAELSFSEFLQNKNNADPNQSLSLKTASLSDNPLSRIVNNSRFAFASGFITWLTYLIPFAGLAFSVTSIYANIKSLRKGEKKKKHLISLGFAVMSLPLAVVACLAPFMMINKA